MLVSPADGVTVGEDGVMPWQLEKQSRSSPPKDNGNNSGLPPVRMEPVARGGCGGKVVAAQQLRRQREIRMREEQQQRQQQPPGRRVQWQPEQQQQQFPAAHKAAIPSTLSPGSDRMDGDGRLFGDVGEQHATSTAAAAADGCRPTSIPTAAIRDTAAAARPASMGVPECSQRLQRVNRQLLRWAIVWKAWRRWRRVWRAATQPKDDRRQIGTERPE